MSPIYVSDPKKIMQSYLTSSMLVTALTNLHYETIKQEIQDDHPWNKMIQKLPLESNQSPI